MYFHWQINIHRERTVFAMSTLVLMYSHILEWILPILFEFVFNMWKCRERLQPRNILSTWTVDTRQGEFELVSDQPKGSQETVGCFFKICVFRTPQRIQLCRQTSLIQNDFCVMLQKKVESENYPSKHVQTYSQGFFLWLSGISFRAPDKFGNICMRLNNQTSSVWFRIC